MTKDASELLTLLLPDPRCWYDRDGPTPNYCRTGDAARASCVLGKHSQN